MAVKDWMLASPNYRIASICSLVAVVCTDSATYTTHLFGDIFVPKVTHGAWSLDALTLALLWWTGHRIIRIFVYSVFSPPCFLKMYFSSFFQRIPMKFDDGWNPARKPFRIFRMRMELGGTILRNFAQKGDVVSASFYDFYGCEMLRASHHTNGSMSCTPWSLLVESQWMSRCTTLHHSSSPFGVGGAGHKHRCCTYGVGWYRPSPREWWECQTLVLYFGCCESLQWLKTVIHWVPLQFLPRLCIYFILFCCDIQIISKSYGLVSVFRIAWGEGRVYFFPLSATLQPV